MQIIKFIIVRSYYYCSGCDECAVLSPGMPGFPGKTRDFFLFLLKKAELSGYGAGVFQNQLIGFSFQQR
jgi:hypothetical protein